MGCSKCIRAGYAFCRADPDTSTCVKKDNSTYIRTLSRGGYACSTALNTDNAMAVYEVCKEEYKD